MKNEQLRNEGKEVTFKKEPDFGDSEIIRGALSIGKDERASICFAWDVSERKLYLDLADLQRWLASYRSQGHYGRPVFKRTASLHLGPWGVDHFNRSLISA